ncbi:MAG: PIG-L family deacetylase [Gemmatimonadales bacterium]|nr:PIG-L family deacetylase [Gemmatimonadales bacterium]
MRLQSLASVLLLTLSFLPRTSAAQLAPPSTGGIVTLEHELRMLGHDKRVLLIGAHPDDEDTELLTILVRGEGAEAAYLSLNRGEGGQNLIGSELGDALGLLRTEELLAARQLDGAQQFFTRAYDFGFSKTLDDTWAHWPRDSVLKDVVRIVRRFRPQVIVSIFSGTPRDGHGQHQAAGWAALEAFRIAGDSTRFPELLREEGLAAWTPFKLFRNARFDTAGAVTMLEGGALDPAVGQSFHQIAMQGRSRHRSQDMGQLQLVGSSPGRLTPWLDRTGRNGGIFSGIDTTFGGAAGAAYTVRVDSLREWRSLSPARFGALADRLDRDIDAMGPAGAGQLSMAWREQHLHLARARVARFGWLFDAVADDDHVVAGQPLGVQLSIWNGGQQPESLGLGVRASGPWTLVDSVRSPVGAIRPMALRSRRVTLTPAPDAPVTTPYFLESPRAGSMYVWPRAAIAEWGTPFGAPPLMAALATGSAVRTERPLAGPAVEIAFRFNDQALGEQRRPVAIVPRIDVKIDPDTALWVIGSRAARRFQVKLGHGARDSTSGRVRLIVPVGWTAPAPRAFSLSRENATATFDFDVTAPAGLLAGPVEIRAEAEDERGRRYALGVYTVTYPHIRPRTYTAPASAHVVAAPLAVPRLARVGYVRGAADRVPESLIGVGVPVTVLDAAALARGDLSVYDAIIIGPRAYETDTALVAHNDRILAYARNGGLVITQYQQYQFVRAGFAPFPLTIATPHDRVTDEGAPVRAVDSTSAALQRPNTIGASDWQGWVQERGLYFAHTWDPAFRPVLESHDPGEAPQLGSLLIAPLGRGTYVYTGIAFFRQLPAGVPGAYRLLANLLGLSRKASP